MLIDQIKSALGTVEKIASQNGMELHGNRPQLTALCPFHNEHTPSFTIYTSNDKYFCFGCKAHGDAIDLLAHFRGRTVDTTFLRDLADELGIENKTDKYKTHRDILQQVSADYHTALFQNKTAKMYLRDRNIMPATAKEFQLGFADGMLHACKREELYDLGLIKQSEHGDYDFFRDRLIVPITVNNQVRGFGGRTLVDNDRKYINSPAHALFDKGRILFGLDKVKITDGTLVLVEGYFDVIGLWQAGYRNAVALMGTALTKYHLNEISGRQISRIVLALDSDNAGIKATWASAKVIAQYLPKMHINALLMPEGDSLYGMDPDEIVAQSQDLWGDLIEMAPPIWQVYVDFVMGYYRQVKRSEDRQKLLIKSMDFLSNLSGFMASEGKSYLAEETKLSLTILSELEAPRRKVTPQVTEEAPASTIPSLITNTLNTIARHPTAVEIVNENLKSVGLSPIGEIDFGKYWKNQDGVPAWAGNVEHPDEFIYENILRIRKKRLPGLMLKDQSLVAEWSTLVKL